MHERKNMALPQGLMSGLAALSKKMDEAKTSVDGALPRQRSLPAFSPGFQQQFRLSTQQQRRRQRSAPRQLAQPARRVMLNGRFAAIIPGDGVVEQVFTSGLGSFLSLYNAALIGRLVLTWFPSPPAAIVGPLSTICDPYLNLFRGIIPPLGGTIDLSPILAFIVLDVFTNSAQALPCEMGADGQPIMQAPRQKGWTPGRSLAAFQQKVNADRQRRQAKEKRQQAQA